MNSDDLQHTVAVIECTRKLILNNAKMVMVHTKRFLGYFEGMMLIIDRVTFLRAVDGN
jgi:hypothetical protein